MPNEKKYYEGMFITKGGGGEDAWETSRSTVHDILDDYDTEVDYVENWSDQQFEYEIDKERRGKYVLTYFQSDPQAINDIKEDVSLNERILRVLILNRGSKETYEQMIEDRIKAKEEEEAEEEEEGETEDEPDESDETSAADEEVTETSDQPADESEVDEEEPSTDESDTVEEEETEEPDETVVEGSETDELEQDEVNEEPESVEETDEPAETEEAEPAKATNVEEENVSS